MAKKAASDWNMSQAIRDHLTANPGSSAAEAMEALSAQNPSLNKNSFTVAFYTMKKKMGLASSGKRGKAKRTFGARVSKPAPSTGMTLNMDALKHAAKLVSEVGADAAIQLIKVVETVQVK